MRLKSRLTLFVYEAVIGGIAVVSGTGTLCGGAPPSSIVRLLPAALQVTWGLLLLAGGIAVLWGLLQDKETAMVGGLYLLGSAYTVYSLALVVVNGHRGVVSGLMASAIAGGCLARAGWLRHGQVPT